MVRLSIGKFNEKGTIEQAEVDLPADVLAVCMAPVRFMGGGCDLFYVCTRRHEGYECKAEASQDAREKAEHEVREGAGEEDEVQPEHKCAICDELIKLEGGDAPYLGDEGTRYAGRPVCDSCYDEDLSEPCAKIIRGTDPDGEDETQMIGTCRNETEGDFEVHWTSTDPWRGYYGMRSSRYVLLYSDTILSGDSSERRLKEFYDLLLEKLGAAEIDTARCFPRTSNLFACGLEVWVEKKRQRKAKSILAQCKNEKEV